MVIIVIVVINCVFIESVFQVIDIQEVAIIIVVNRIIIFVVFFIFLIVVNIAIIVPNVTAMCVAFLVESRLAEWFSKEPQSCTTPNALDQIQGLVVRSPIRFRKGKDRRPQDLPAEPRRYGQIQPRKFHLVPVLHIVEVQDD